MDDTLTTGQLDVILKRYAGEEAQWTGDNGTPTSITRGRLALLLSQTRQEAGVLAVARQGMFSTGGTVTAPVEGEYDSTTNWLELERHGNTAHVGHANVLYQIPEGESGLPMVHLHGYGQSRMGGTAGAPCSSKRGTAPSLWTSRAGARREPLHR